MANNYTLGRGEIYFGQFIAGTQNPEGERYIGNTPEFVVNLESEMLDHFNSDRGIREKDDSVTLQINRTGSLSTDNISPENLAILFMGQHSIQAQAATAVVGESIGQVKKGLFYQLGTTTANPSGVRDVSTVVIKDTETVPTTYVLNTDYRLDAALGRIEIISSAMEGKTITADYTPAAKSRVRVVSKGETIEGSLRFIAYNPKGDQLDYYMPWVKLTANGDFSLKGEEWLAIPFALEILSKSGLEAIYIDGRPYTPA